ncbi:FAD binding domain protein [Aspergillus clavatus NRRL 1]|uniref:FAD binding domain protein n=1 Tax=Aspergillus clavatus (strain ATCC 1007 / CBS 513.65 / DSM 816 / NCTC 3887 / NRRL 1 / QM 1276 / 107) TaxID=344612 RepID=A1CUQ8_ASPCL|nr:FAD binding domain protein [Aspergillus clavatus NRRL 1]EAW07045.1 FAD binding domain protein [Aspergillus clavatus NRRL 1]
MSRQPVLIVGGNLVGLSAALCLAAHNVPTIVFEKHAKISEHPRAIGFTARTLEIFHALGISDQIPEVPSDFTLLRARVESLTGKWFERTSWQDTTEKPSHDQQTAENESKPTSGEKGQYSPFRGAAIPQDKLESILEKAALSRGVDIRRQHTVTKVEQNDSEVLVTVLDAQGTSHQLRGLYLIAADGNRSGIREQLQIARTGRGHMQIMRSVLFRAPLEDYLKGVHQFNIEQGDFKAFLTTYNDGRWVLMFYDDLERDSKTQIADIRRAVGKSDIPVEIITTGRWEMTALVAERFQVGRIFLAGDAAHALPPNRGGYGANTGIHDAHNLAWKIAAVLKEESMPELLDTYDAERRPVALLRHDQIFVRADYKMHLEGKDAGERLDDDAMEFGELYRSRGVIGAEDGLSPAKKPDEWKGQPGTHLPHFWVTKAGKTVSIADVTGMHGWTVVSASVEWGDAVRKLNERSPVKLKHLHIGQDVQLNGSQNLTELMGLSNTGASLVRPDGYIAWRTVEIPCDPVDDLLQALNQVAFIQ